MLGICDGEQVPLLFVPTSHFELALKGRVVSYISLLNTFFAWATSICAALVWDFVRKATSTESEQDHAQMYLRRGRTLQVVGAVMLLAGLLFLLSNLMHSALAEPIPVLQVIFIGSLMIETGANIRKLASRPLKAESHS